jgi:uncharacterized protein YegL
MRNDLTELVFLLDRSGSMGGLESDTIGGYNALLEKQKTVPGEAIVTTVLFDDRYELLHDRIMLSGISPITGQDYFVRGSTALLDAIGTTIHKIANAHRHTDESQRPGKTLMVITTDGLENASREYTCQKVRQLIEHQKDEFGWEFLFLGANIDAITTAGKFGIAADRAVNYHADSKGTRLNYEVVSDAASCLRASCPLDGSWKKRIDRDYIKRGGEDSIQSQA